jgi:hypothetical protein
VEDNGWLPKKSIKTLNAEENVIAYDFSYDEVAVAA